VEGGADTVIDALCEVLGPAGTLVMPTFCWGRFHGRDHVTFDMRNTPSETGRITEVFRHRPGAMRSEHIDHSVAASGPNWKTVMGDGISAWGAGSSFDALYQLDAWVLLLGVGFGICTALHAAEERARVYYRRYRPFADSTVVLADGRRKPSPSVEFARRAGYSCDLAKMEAYFAQYDLFHETQIGRARVINMRIRTIIDRTVALLEDDEEALLTKERPDDDARG
jgi:aminoglycoside 3-N-acetyltransferase